MTHHVPVVGEAGAQGQVEAGRAQVVADLVQPHLRVDQGVRDYGVIQAEPDMSKQEGQ